jgi:ribosomal protein S18 acetylase RimI-like enzyme
MSEIVVETAGIEDVPAAALLFHHYRLFYNLVSNFDDCADFIRDRIANDDSTIFVAWMGPDNPVGFVQMYPLFSEVSLKKVWLVNDLYVEESARRKGVAELLMHQCAEFVREKGGSELTLATAPENVIAQALYRKLGYVKNDGFWVYSLYL